MDLLVDHSHYGPTGFMILNAVKSQIIAKADIPRINAGACVKLPHFEMGERSWIRSSHWLHIRSSYRSED